MDLVPGRSGTAHENWLEERGEDFRAGVRIATLDPYQGQQERHRRSTPRRHQRLKCLPYRQARWQRSRSRHPGSPRTQRRSPLSDPASFARLTHAGSPHVKRNASVRPSRQMRRISVSKSPTFTGQVRDVFHQATPTQGQRLAVHLIESLPRCPIPEIARLGRALRKWKDALDARFDTDGASNGPTEAINGHYRAGQTNRQRLPQPHQRPTPNAPHRRRPRRLHPHPTMKNPKMRRAPLIRNRRDSRLIGQNVLVSV